MMESAWKLTGLAGATLSTGRTFFCGGTSSESGEDYVAVSECASFARADRRRRLFPRDSGGVLFGLMEGGDFFQDAMHA